MVGVFAMVDKGNGAFFKYKDRLPVAIKSSSNYEEIVNRKEEQCCNKEVILFFSFDVVNSSLYKTINYNGWASVLMSLFNKIQKIVKESIDGAELWRVLGDEAIFIVRINTENEIYKYIDIINDILISMVNDLKNGNMFENLSYFTKDERDLMKKQNIISLKGAAWIAVVSKMESNGTSAINGEYENISAQYNASDKYKIFEFLGNDIDTGFRISKETTERRLIISFELAYMLSKRTECLSKIFIITYKKLKGVWQNKLYPIIWYYDKDKCNNINFDESFYYDEIEECELVKEYFNNRVIKDGDRVIRQGYMFTDVIKAFEKILNDRNLEKKIKKIYNTIEKSTIANKEYIKVDLLELHCVSVCFDESSGRILIAKRNMNKDNNPGLWEFGCAKARLSERFSQSIIEEYKNNFGIDIEPITDESRNENQPIPIAIYEMPKKDGIHKGIITLGKITNNIKLEEFKGTEKHNELRWISEEEVQEFNEKAVPDFKETLNLAFQKIKDLKGSKNIDE